MIPKVLATSGKAAYERHKRNQLGVDYPNAAPFEELDPREQEAWNRSAGKVLTPAEVAEILARSEKATRGPWKAPLKDLGEVESFKAVDFYFDHAFEAYPPMGESGPVFVANSPENANFLFNARTDVPALCVTITRLRGLIEGLPCEFDCESTVRQSECSGYGKCNCVKSKVNL